MQARTIMLVVLGVTRVAHAADWMQANAGSPYISVPSPTFSDAPLAVRLTSMVVSHGPSKGRLLSAAGAEVKLLTNMALDVQLVADSMLGAPGSQYPESAALRMRWAPSNLGWGDGGLAFTLGGAYATELGFRAGESRQVNVTGSVLVGQRWDRLSLAFAGWAGAQAPQSSGLSPQLSGSFAAIYELCGRACGVGLDVLAARELTSVSDWQALVSASGTLPLAGLASLRVGAQAVIEPSGKVRPAGVIALVMSAGMGDSDSDALLDEADACPYEAGSESCFGCPCTDVDDDGVWDRVDACPEEAGPASNAGCTPRDLSLAN